MANEISTMTTIQQKVSERLRASFVELIPDEVWDKMVADELTKFTKDDLPKLVHLAAKDRLMELLKVEFCRPEWLERWGWNNAQSPSAMVSTILKELAPDLVAALFSNVAQSAVMQIRNGNIRL